MSLPEAPVFLLSLSLEKAGRLGGSENLGYLISERKTDWKESFPPMKYSSGSGLSILLAPEIVVVFGLWPCVGAPLQFWGHFSLCSVPASTGSVREEEESKERP